MKAYVMTTGAIFGLLLLVHIARLIQEGTGLLSEASYVITTLAAAAMSVWARQFPHAVLCCCQYVHEASSRVVAS